MIHIKQQEVFISFSSVIQLSLTLLPHGLQHARRPCPFILCFSLTVSFILKLPSVPRAELCPGMHLINVRSELNYGL